MDEQQIEMVRLTATNVQSAIGDTAMWEWDARFSGALTTFEKSNEPIFLQALSHFFAHEWTIANIGNAPESVLIAADFLGGLRAGQRLYTTDPALNPMCMAAYWPWGNGTTISLRILPTSLDAGPSEMGALVLKFQKWMNL